MHLKSHWISEKIYFGERTNYIYGMFWVLVQFLFIFFDCRTLKFLKMKCNPTNKKIVAVGIEH